MDNLNSSIKKNSTIRLQMAIDKIIQDAEDNNLLISDIIVEVEKGESGEAYYALIISGEKKY